MLNSRLPANLANRGLSLGLGVAILLFPRMAWADLYSPFVWNLTFAAVCLLPVIAFVEGLILWKLCGLSAARSLWVAFLINLSSTLVGILLSVIIGLSGPVLDPPLIAGFFVGTVWIEGRLLARFSPSLPRPYSLSFRMNLASYAILVVCAGYLAHKHQTDKLPPRYPPSPATFPTN